MPQELLGGYPQVAVFLEAVVKEVLDDGRSAVWDWRAVVLHYPEERGHRVQEVVWRLAFEELYDCTAYAPE